MLTIWSRLTLVWSWDFNMYWWAGTPPSLFSSVSLPFILKQNFQNNKTGILYKRGKKEVKAEGGPTGWKYNLEKEERGLTSNLQNLYVHSSESDPSVWLPLHLFIHHGKWGLKHSRDKTWSPLAPAHSLSFSAPSHFTFGTFICVYLRAVTEFEKKKQKKQQDTQTARGHGRKFTDEARDKT